jgi:hypothetical protein
VPREGSIKNGGIRIGVADAGRGDAAALQWGALRTADGAAGDDARVGDGGRGASGGLQDMTGSYAVP